MALAIGAIAACTFNATGLPCAPRDTACLRHAQQSHAVRSARFWERDRARPLGERIGPAPPQLIEFITLDNVLNGYPERPRSAQPDPAFMSDVKAAIADLPPEVWRLFGERLIGIYFVEDLGGTGYTDAVLDAHGKQAAGFVVLDASLLKHHTANGWATWKENTPFKRGDPQFKLHARIENNADDNRKNAIQYILLHELGHVLSIGGDIHPPWNEAPAVVPEDARYGYFELSWRIERAANRYVSVFDNAFARRKDIAYYFGAKLGAVDMEPVYTQLEQTNFASLYAATRPGDDFAEAFASYVHVVLMRRPWLITISRDGEVQKTFKACWDEPRCDGKRQLLDRMLLGRS